jgi:sugar transferase (PEP-CTERM/EpsH1 system associated)
VPPLVDKLFVMDFVDDDSAKYEAYAERAWGLGRWLFRREGRRLLAFERGIAARADISFFVTEAEAELFRRRAAVAAEVRALGNGVDLDFFRPGTVQPEATPRPLVVFTGQMDYAPNVEAVTGFAAAQLPRLRAAIPDLRFAIVGRNPAPAIRRLAAAPGILVTGAVPDVRPWLAAADVVVAPLRLARGVQNKVLEAMAMARPVVASRAAYEGIEAVPGRDLLVAEDAAPHILALLRDPGRAASLGESARAQVERAYAWDARMRPLIDLLEGCRQRAAA